MLSLYRDVLSIQLATGSALVNADLLAQMQSLAQESTSAQTITKLDAIATARIRVDANVQALLALEALAVALRRIGD
jgi:DNA polymerase-3 subunit delta'